MYLIAVGMPRGKTGVIFIQATGIILAGGKNSRMGKNKAFLRVGNQRIIDRTVAQLQQCCNQIVIVSNEPEKYTYLGVEVVTDIIPGLGPLSGMHAGLQAADNEYSLVTACDMPFMDPQIGKKLLDEAEGYDVVVPRIGDHLEPLFAVYARTCVEPIEECLRNSVSKIIAFYPRVKVKYVDGSAYQGIKLNRVFMNVNTPEELEQARSIIQQQESGRQKK